MSLWSRITSTLWRSKPEAKDLLRLWRIRFWMGLLALVAAWGLQLVLQQKGFLEHFDEFDADQYARSDALPTEYSGRITIVAVNEHDYHDAHLFAAKSPLEPKK